MTVTNSSNDGLILRQKCGNKFPWIFFMRRIFSGMKSWTTWFGNVIVQSLCVFCVIPCVTSTFTVLNRKGTGHTWKNTENTRWKHRIWQFFGPWASPYGANGQITMTVHNYRSRQSGVYTKFSSRLSEEPLAWLIQKFPCILIFNTGQPGCQLNLSKGQIRLDLTSGRPL